MVMAIGIKVDFKLRRRVLRYKTFSFLFLSFLKLKDDGEEDDEDEIL